MTTDEDRLKMTSVITEAITALCQKDLKFENELTVEGLLGITLDNKDVFLVNIKEIVKPYESHNGLYLEANLDCEKPLEILNRTESIFPKGRKKRKSIAVKKRKTSFPGAESRNVNDIMFYNAKSAPCDISSNMSIGMGPIFCEDLSLKDSAKHFLDIPDNRHIVDGLFDDAKDHVGDQSNHSGLDTFPKDVADQTASLEQSPKMSNTDPFPFLGGISADWNIDMPLNLADEKPVEVKEQVAGYITL